MNNARCALHMTVGPFVWLETLFVTPFSMHCYTRTDTLLHRFWVWGPHRLGVGGYGGFRCRLFRWFLVYRS